MLCLLRNFIWLFGHYSIIILNRFKICGTLQMSYIERNLLENEQIVRQGHRHWIVFVWPIIWLTIGLILLMPNVVKLGVDIIPVQFVSLINVTVFQKLIFLPFLLGMVTGIGAVLNYFVSEIALTNIRVLMKIGLIKRVSIEIPLRNVATIRVVQGLWGRLFNYGTIEICDVGNVCLIFRRLVEPVLFRSEIEEEMHRKPAQFVQPVVKSEVKHEV
jgi:hypothetical protein